MNVMSPHSHGTSLRLRATFVCLCLLLIGALSAHGQIRINEVFASGNVLNDVDGDSSDWIELYNTAGTTVSLNGWYLTDDAASKTKWQIPNVGIGAGKYKIIFCSGKDRRNPAAELHTNFSLSADGEYLGLIRPDGTTVECEYAPTFPAQKTNYSYGYLSTATSNADPRYYFVPTPGAANGSAFNGFVADVTFSRQRGFVDSPFALTLATTTTGATIRYTTDASTPTLLHGTVYASPIQTTRTTVVRTIAYKAGFIPAATQVSTYIFRDNILTQTRPSDYPTQTYDPAHPLDYDVDYKVVGTTSTFGALYRNQLRDSVAALPTLAITMDKEDMFGLAKGIYANSNQSGDAWERAASIEYIDSTHSLSLQVNAGMRMHGGYGRNAFETPKHSFRVLFSSDYGPSKLEGKIFSDSPVTEFDTLIVRSTTHDSWLTQQANFRNNAIYGKDAWARQTQRDMGYASIHGQYVQVFVNGLYWGMYELVERPTAAFAASYLGGSKDDYDDMDGQPGGAVVHDGTGVAWNTMQTILAGNGPHGTLTNAAAYADLKQYLNTKNLADYIITGVFSAISDWPGWNWYSARRRTDPAGTFQVFSWDAEAAMTSDRINYNKLTQSGFNDGVGKMFIQALVNPDFKMLVADRIYADLVKTGGALTAPKSQARLAPIIASARRGLVGELARWGDSWIANPTQYNAGGAYDTNVNFVTNSFFVQRPAVTVGLFRNYGAYPAIDPPTYNQDGGVIASGFQLAVTNPNGSGSIYYTADGSDPRAPATGGVTTTTEVLALSAAKKVFIPTGDIGTAWRGGTAFNDAAWTAGTPTIAGKEGAVGFDNNAAAGGDYNAFITYNVGTAMFTHNATCYVRVPFTVTSGMLTGATGLTFLTRYDDGFVAYIDGVQVASVNAPATLAWNSAATSTNDNGQTFTTFDISTFLPSLTAGSHVLAIQVMNGSAGGSSDAIISPRITISKTVGGNTGSIAPTAHLYNPGDPIPVGLNTTIKSRVLSGVVWSAVNEAAFQTTSTLIHYWNFNDVAHLLTPTFTAGGASIVTNITSPTQVLDSTGQNFAGTNARNGDPVGSHLRVNNPIGSTITLHLSTAGYQSVTLKYETRRSGSGAGLQNIAYTLNGTTFTSFTTVVMQDADPVIQTLDFSGIAGANNNPDFAVRIGFALGAGGNVGNDRFDDITLEGLPMAGANFPPVVASPIDFVSGIEGDSAATTVSLAGVFTDPNNDPLTYSATVDRSSFATASVSGSVLTLHGLLRGETNIVVQATDGQTTPAQSTLRFLIQPAAHHLASAFFNFDDWSPFATELTYPPNMLFVQSANNDTSLTDALDHAYYIPPADYAPTDNVGFPYKAASRTRINGLGADGISFINTGRNRDLGAAIVALDTRGVSQAYVRWTGGTLLRNSRIYALRLQYRLGATGAFQDVLVGGQPVQYTAAADGDAKLEGPTILPPALLGQPYVQLAWRYYHVSVDTGARAQLRLDGVLIGTGNPNAVSEAKPGAWVQYQ